ncbi:hypothetical protein D3C85_1686620 [compost metagenome]
MLYASKETALPFTTTLAAVGAVDRDSNLFSEVTVVSLVGVVSSTTCKRIGLSYDCASPATTGKTPYLVGSVNIAVLSLISILFRPSSSSNHCAIEVSSENLP